MGRGGGSSSRGSSGSSSSGRGSSGRSGGSFSSGRGGGYSSGGRSAGSRSSYGSSHRSSGYNRGFRGFSPVSMSRRRPGPGTSSSGCGCSPLILGIVVILIVVGIIIASSSGAIFGQSGGGSDVTKSTVQRVALPAGSVNETGYYTDELGWIDNETKLLAGMKNFYQETGVQPYLYITDTVNGSHSPTATDLKNFTEGLYDDLFTDEAHLLLVFFEYNSNSNYMDHCVRGIQAKTVIDDEAADILLDYIGSYYFDNSLSEAEFFSKAFNDAAQRIMTVTRSPWIAVFIVIGVLALVVILFVWWNHNKKQKNLEAQQTEEMLKTPLEKFGDSEVEDLTKKYDGDT